MSNHILKIIIYVIYFILLLMMFRPIFPDAIQRLLAKKKTASDSSVEKFRKRDVTRTLMDLLGNDTAVKDENINSEGLQDRLYKMIDYAIKRHDWYEDQRQRLLTIGLAMAGLVAPMTALIIGQTTNHFADLNEISKAFFIGVIAFLLLTAISLLYQYQRLIGPSRQYTYRPMADIISWYFRYNLKDYSPVFLSDNPNQRQEQLRQVGELWDEFIGRFKANAHKQQFIVEDLEQVFILQALQAYKRESLTEMVTTLRYGIIGFSVSLFGCLAVLLTFTSTQSPAQIPAPSSTIHNLNAKSSTATPKIPVHKSGKHP